MDGSIDDWDETALDGFTASCAQSLDALCFVNSVSGGSVVIEFTAVRYAYADGVILPLDLVFSNPTAMMAFQKALKAATGFTFQSWPTVKSVVSVSANNGGERVYAETVSPGGIAGIVIAGVVFIAALLGGYLYVWRRRRNAAPTLGKTIYV